MTDIATVKNDLLQLINKLSDEYSEMLEEKCERVVRDNKDVLMVNNENKILKNNIVEHETEIRELKKKNYEYEQMINKYQDNMIELEEEHKCNDKVSIVKSQAKAIKEKDDYIDQLEYKIKNMKESKNVKSQIIGFSPTSSSTPVKNEPEPLKLEEKSSSDDDIELKTVKYEKNRYYIIVGEMPQYVYKIDNGELGDRVGKRTKKLKGKGYDYDFD
jgi:uncharacterized phage infection (PIP) family protein YhgE